MYNISQLYKQHLVTSSVKTYCMNVHHWSRHTDWYHHSGRKSWRSDHCHKGTDSIRILQCKHLSMY